MSGFGHGHADLVPAPHYVLPHYVIHEDVKRIARDMEVPDSKEGTMSMMSTSHRTTEEPSESGPIHELEVELDRFDVALNELEGRLGPVLRSPDVQAELATVQAPPVSRIAELRNEMTHRISRLQAITERIDL